MKIISWNVNGLRAVGKKGVFMPGSDHCPVGIEIAS